MGMDREAVAERIRDFVIETGDWPKPREALTLDVPLLNHVIDSIGVISLVSLIESEFGVTVDDNDLAPANFATIGSVVAFVERRR